MGRVCSAERGKSCCDNDLAREGYLDYGRLDVVLVSGLCFFGDNARIDANVFGGPRTVVSCDVPCVSIPVKFLNFTNFGLGGLSKKDRLGRGGGSRSRSGSDGIVCVVVT